MLDGGGTLVVGGGDVAEEDWKLLLRKLREIARERTKLEAKEIDCLIEAEEARLHLRLGYATFRELMERDLGWGPHAANERLRVAHELLDLPLLREEFAAGYVKFTVVRELTRVATAETEEVWLAKAEGKTVRQVEHLVKGRKKGDVPEDPIDPSKILERVVFEVSGATYALLRRVRVQMERECGETLSDDEFVNALARGGGAADKVSPPSVQVAVVTCRACKKGWQVGAGEAVELPAEELACALCDAIDIGHLDTDELTRPKSNIPEAIRRKVWVRDKGGCTVPGCRSRRYLQVHHVVHQEDGGEHRMSNCTLLCSIHHRQHHKGLIEITGEAPELTFTRRHDHDGCRGGPTGDRKA